MTAMILLALLPACRTGGTFRAGNGTQKINVEWSLFSEMAVPAADQHPAPASE